MSCSVEKIKFGKEELVVETGSLAKQANGTVLVSYGGTVVLVTACMAREAKEDIDFFPLTVDYQEKTYAVGKIPGGFFKREGKPSESEILVSRLIDRPIRPLFPKGLLNEVQIMAIVLSSDSENDPDVLAVNGASLALLVSDIPFEGPVACCRVARVAREFILNPTYLELESADLDLVVAMTFKGIVMLETKAKQIKEEDYLKALEFAEDPLRQILDFQKNFQARYGKPKANYCVYLSAPEKLKEQIKEISFIELERIYSLDTKEKQQAELGLLLKQLQEKFITEGYTKREIKLALEELEKDFLRKMIFENNQRIDKRGFTELRPISCAVSVLPRTHGSSLFTRGQTQSLCVTTLGTGEDKQLIEALEGEQYKSFMLHYSFPPFSVGEISPVRGPGRREIGHGALAEKALLAVIPSKEEFPYTIRVVSEILESNGSSSMATVCAASLSLMDAGVPIKEAVAGVALGLISDVGKEIILTDIAGLEDRFGEMDFKVAGTKNGITAIQLDLKIKGISLELIRKALFQAKQAREEILEKMNAVIKEPRKEISVYAPRIVKLKVDPEKIGELIGPGGKTIKKIISQTGVTIEIEEEGDILVSGLDLKKVEEAAQIIRAITEGIEVGKIYTGRVKRIAPYGVFVELFPGKEGLVHISELADYFVRDIEDEVKVGQEIKVKVINIDEQGRIALSRKQVKVLSE